MFCLACFTGHYPIPVQLEMDKLALESLPARSAAKKHKAGATGR
jgi:hypothetical protein